MGGEILRRHPQRITLLSPLVTYLFTFFAGTGHVAYSVLPVIAEVARETGIRPERPMGIAVHCFPAGYYCQSYFCGYGSPAEYVGRI